MPDWMKRGWSSIRTLQGASSKGKSGKTNQLSLSENLPKRSTIISRKILMTSSTGISEIQVLLFLKKKYRPQISGAAYKLAGNRPDFSEAPDGFMMMGLDREEYEEYRLQEKMLDLNWRSTVSQFETELEQFLIYLWTWFPLFVEYSELDLEAINPDDMELIIDFNNLTWLDVSS